ncbi:MAG: HNH endonuclease [Candidatus Aenigmarchaeota archaeon]|nr:HNH endonuclease [Candidatus Aenigmarchaeota archaeon]
MWEEEKAGGKRKKFSRTDEKAIYSRYKGRCAICGRKTEFYDGEVDHIKPLAKGGSNSPSNLQWLCHRCNKLKGSKRTNAQVKELLGLKTKRAAKRAKKRTKRKKPKEYDIFGLPRIKPIRLGI